MGTYVNNGKVALGSSYDYDDAVREIAGLIGVGRRSDGRHHLADVCQAKSVNIWARKKPEGQVWGASYNWPVINLSDADRLSNGYGIVAKRQQLTSVNRHLHWITYSKKDVSKNRLRDFDGYNHLAKSGLQFTTPSTDVVNGFTVELNPNTGDNITIKDLEAIYDANTVEGIGTTYDYGIMILSNSYFILLEEVVGDYEDFLSWADNGALKSFITDRLFKREPKGLDGFIFWYARPTSSYNRNNIYMLTKPSLLKNGSVQHTMAIDGYEPEMKVGTTTSGRKPINEWNDNGEVIMYGRDDYMWFNFSIFNGGIVSAYPSWFKVIATIDGTDYMLPLIDGEAGSISATVHSGSNSATNLLGARWCIYMNSILEIISNSKTAKDITFRVAYEEEKILPSDLLPNYEDAYLSSAFTVKMQYNGGVVDDTIDPPSGVIPVPPAGSGWDEWQPEW